MSIEVKESKQIDHTLLECNFKTGRPQVSYVGDSGLEAEYHAKSNTWYVMFEVYPEDSIEDKKADFIAFVQEVIEEFGAR